MEDEEEGDNKFDLDVLKGLLLRGEGDLDSLLLVLAFVGTVASWETSDGKVDALPLDVGGSEGVFDDVALTLPKGEGEAALVRDFLSLVEPFSFRFFSSSWSLVNSFFTISFRLMFRSLLFSHTFQGLICFH